MASIEYDLDISALTRIDELYCVGWRSVEAYVGPRRFKVSIYENLSSREPPLFSANYEEHVMLEIDGDWRPLWAKANFPWEAADTVEDCFQRALAHVNRA
jgi:hypothetical protein